jgi:hypothetical protein
MIQGVTGSKHSHPPYKMCPRRRSCAVLRLSRRIQSYRAAKMKTPRSYRLAMHLFIPAIWITAGVSLYVGVFFMSTSLISQNQSAFIEFDVLTLLIRINLKLPSDFYSMHCSHLDIAIAYH